MSNVLEYWLTESEKIFQKRQEALINKKRKTESLTEEMKEYETVLERYKNFASNTRLMQAELTLLNNELKEEEEKINGRNATTHSKDRLKEIEKLTEELEELTRIRKSKEKKLIDEMEEQYKCEQNISKPD